MAGVRASIDVDSPDAGAPHGGIITLLALCFAAGIGAGRLQPEPRIWAWLAAASALTAVSFVLASRPRVRFAALAAVTLALGAGWYALRMHHVALHDLTAIAREAPQLIRAEGVALRSPDLRHRTAGSFARFDYHPPATYIPMRIEALIGRDGSRHGASGRVLVRVDETVAPFRAGDHVRVTGMLTRPAPPKNPGEFDYQRYALALGQAGVLSVRSRELLEVTPAERDAVTSAILDLRDRAQRRAKAWLLSDLPHRSSPERDALLAAILLGQRERQLDDLGESFRRVGLAHLLAISGLHLGIFVGFALIIVRWTGHTRRWHGLLVIALVLAYLFIIEVRLPVLRAGVMLMAAGLGVAAGRRWPVRSLISLSAVGLLIWRPEQLFDAGFQLSFGVVLALVHLVPYVRRWWFGRPRLEATTSAEMIGEWLKNTLVVAVVAWAVATPIVAYHFGIVSPFAVPMSMIALPIVAMLLAIGYTKIALSLLLPSGALLSGALLSVAADVLIAIVTAIDALPGSVIHVPHPSSIWTLVALSWVTLAGLGYAQRLPRLWIVAGVSILIWLFAPLISFGERPALRIDMLAVGDGSCFVLRSGGETILFDAGSSSDLNAGRRVIVPALRRLGVRSIDAILISHPNLDHYAATPDLIDAFRVRRVFVTPQLLREARANPEGPIHHLLQLLSSRYISVEERAAGDAMPFGEVTLTWIHPLPDRDYERRNNGSMVLSIEAAGRRVLMTGDIQPDAISELRRREPKLRADIVELPHHGSYNDEVAALIEQLEPELVMQSTAWRRWRRDRWADALGGVERLITTRDGACRIEIEPDGSLSTDRFLESDGGRTTDDRDNPA
jgi:competence protein ComEC